MATGSQSNGMGDGELKRSSDRILTTHVGSLPGLSSFDPSSAGYREQVTAGVKRVVEQQREAGLDIINEGEYSKGGDWLSYVDDRFSGFEAQPPQGTPVILQGKDREAFADFYEYATGEGHAVLRGVRGHQAEAPALGLHRARSPTRVRPRLSARIDLLKANLTARRRRHF